MVNFFVFLEFIFFCFVVAIFDLAVQEVEAINDLC